MGTNEGFTPSSPVDPGPTSPSRSALLCFAVAVDVHTHRMRPCEFFYNNVHTHGKSSSLSEGGSGRDAGE